MARQKTRIPDIGDIVYLRTDPEQYPRLITSFVVEPSGMLLYKLALGDRKSDHYEFEMIKDVENRKAVTGFAQKQQDERSNKQSRPPRKVNRGKKTT
jgi:hypothetical protein